MLRKKEPYAIGNIQQRPVKAETAKEQNKRIYGDKIRAFRLLRGMNQPKLAALLGVTKNSVTNWESGVSRPEFDTLAQLCRTLDISADEFFGLPNRVETLAFAEREHLRRFRMLSKYERMSIDKLIDAMVENKELAFREECEKNFERLRRAPLPASAGTGMPLMETNECEYVYLRVSRDVCRADEIITVSGDSMLPTFADGDDLLVEHTKSLAPGEIGIFVVAGEGYVKEYRADGLHSHNPKYKTIRPTEDDNIRCIGRVLGVVDDSWRATPKEQAVLDEIHSSKRHKK
jgi:transcriptional regulator with XRE-family HTH domain